MTLDPGGALLSGVCVTTVKCYITLSPRGLYYKTLRTRNLQERDKLCRKLMPFIVSFKYNSLGKHTSLLLNP